MHQAPSTMNGGEKRNRTASQNAAFVDAKATIRQLRTAIRQFQDGKISLEARREAIDKTTSAMHNGLDAYEARLSDLQELVADTKQELFKAESQRSESTGPPISSTMFRYAAWQDLLAELQQRRDGFMPVPRIYVEAIENAFLVEEAEEALAAGKKIPAEMEVLLAATNSGHGTKLDRWMDAFPQYTEAWALGSHAGLTVTDRQEALGIESLSESDKELLSFGLQNRGLTVEPRLWPDCSLSLSTTLISELTAAIQRTIILEEILNAGCGLPEPYAESHANLILSIGSGSGLLEAHLQSSWSQSRTNLTIHGVEVRNTDYTTPNKYLLFKNRSTVRGTWELSSRLPLARFLVFVYPRQVDLVKRYMEEVARNASSRVLGVIWLGPRNDWDSEDGPATGEGQEGFPMTFKRCFEEAEGFRHLHVLDSILMGLVEYEMMALVTKH